MPYLERLATAVAAAAAARSDITRRRSPTTDVTGTPAAAQLSNAAIIGIAVTGAVVLFVCLALLLIRLAQWQDRRARRAAAVAAAVSLIDGVEPTPVSMHDAVAVEGPRRLRKKSFASDYRRSVDDGGDDGSSKVGGGSRRTRSPSLETGRGDNKGEKGGSNEMKGTNGISLHGKKTKKQKQREKGKGKGKNGGHLDDLPPPPPILPPVLSRPGSFTLSLFGRDQQDRDGDREGGGGGGGGGGGVTTSNAETRSSPKKHSSNNGNKTGQKMPLLQDRHAPPGIDGGALHIPRRTSSLASSPRKNKKAGENGGGSGSSSGSTLLRLGQSLSNKLSWRRDEVTEIIGGRSTLPDTGLELQQGPEAKLNSEPPEPEPRTPTKNVRDKRPAKGLEVRDICTDAVVLPSLLQQQQTKNQHVVGVSPHHKVSVQSYNDSLPGRDSHSGFVVGMPSASVHNPKHRKSHSAHTYSTPADPAAVAAALEATQQLAGGARIPASSIPPCCHQQQQQQQEVPTVVSPQPQRPQPPLRAIKSAADAELAGILRSTAERLQERSPGSGKRSKSTNMRRRQTMCSQGIDIDMEMGMDAGVCNMEMIPIVDRNGFLSGTAAAAATVRTRASMFDDNDNNTSSGAPSPTKSQRSAPAVIECAEPAGCNLKPVAVKATSSPPPSFPFPCMQPQSQSQPQTPGHRRQVSHASFASMISEPDSMMASPSRRGSAQQQQHPHQQTTPTGLSSPSRRRERDSDSPLLHHHNHQQYYGGRPCSTDSTSSSYESSALSTLYSEDEVQAREQEQEQQYQYQHQHQHQQQSPPLIGELRRLDAGIIATTPQKEVERWRPTTTTPKKQAYSSPYHSVFGKANNNDSVAESSSPKEKQGNRNSARSAFAVEISGSGHTSSTESPQTARRVTTRRGTMVMSHQGNTSTGFPFQGFFSQQHHPDLSQEGPETSAASYPTKSLPPRTSLQFTIHSYDDPFVVAAATPAPLKTPSQRGRAFPLLPAAAASELSANEIEPSDTKNSHKKRNKTGLPAELPTIMSGVPPLPLPPPPPKAPSPVPQLHNHKMLRPMVSSPTLGAAGLLEVGRRAAPSPVISEAGVSSVYSSYSQADSVRAVEGNEPSASSLVTTAASSLPAEDAISATAAATAGSSLPHTKTNTGSSGGSPFIASPSGQLLRTGINAASSRRGGGDGDDNNEDNDDDEDSNNSDGAQYCIDSNKGTSSVGHTYYSPHSSPFRTVAAAARVHRKSKSLDPNPRTPQAVVSGTGSSSGGRSGTLPPLPPLTPRTTRKRSSTSTSTNPNNRASLHVASAIVELRRMNSQRSNTSSSCSSTNGGDGDGNAAAAVEEPGSPTLSALRGGGCSPGSRNRDSGRNYLSLGGSPTTPTRAAATLGGGGGGRGRVSGRKSVGNSPTAAGIGKGRRGSGSGSGSGSGLNRRSAPAVGGSRARRGTITRGGGLNSSKSRDGGSGSGSGSGIPGIERMRDGAGLLLMGDGNAGGNVGAGAGTGAGADRVLKREQQAERQPGNLVTRASQLAREERGLLGRTSSIESLGLYDEQGFLKNSPFRDDILSPLSRGDL